MAKIRCIDTPLKKLTTGGVLAGIAFILSALVELKLEVHVLSNNLTYQLHLNRTNEAYYYLGDLSRSPDKWYGASTHTESQRLRIAVYDK